MFFHLIYLYNNPKMIICDKSIRTKNTPAQAAVAPHPYCW